MESIELDEPVTGDNVHSMVYNARYENSEKKLKMAMLPHTRLLTWPMLLLLVSSYYAVDSKGCIT